MARRAQEDEIADQIGWRERRTARVERLKDDLGIIFFIEPQLHELEAVAKRIHDELGRSRINRGISKWNCQLVLLADCGNDGMRDRLALIILIPRKLGIEPFAAQLAGNHRGEEKIGLHHRGPLDPLPFLFVFRNPAPRRITRTNRAEERREGKECCSKSRSRWSTKDSKKTNKENK